MPSTATQPAPLQLLFGDEEYLVEQAIHATVDAVRRADPSAELRQVRVSELTPPELAELVSPSLFAEARVVVLAAAQDAGKEIATAITTYCADPVDGVVLIVTHTGGGRSKFAKDLPAALRSAGAAQVDCGKLTKPADREAFVRNAVRQARGKIDASGVSALLETVGSDLRELAAAASQLVADTDGLVDGAAVRRYHHGRAEVTGFAVADKAVLGDRAGAMEALRWALLLGVPQVVIADALADAVRTVARVSAAGRSDPFRLAGELGMPPWKVKKAQGQSRGWQPEGLAAAMQTVATLNADVKGVAADPNYALERAVLRIVAVHGQH